MRITLPHITVLKWRHSICFGCICRNPESAPLHDHATSSKNYYYAATDCQASKPKLGIPANLSNLARSANLLEGLYILQMFFLYFFTGRLSRPRRSEPNGPIFTKIFRIGRRV